MLGKQLIHSIGARTGSGIPTPVYVASALVYPAWHLVAPPAARDPWAAWWAVSVTFVAVGLAQRWIPAAARHARDLFAACTALVTLHFFLLASVNSMQPFYSVGSALAIVTASLSIRSKPVLLGYGTFVALLGAGLFALAPDTRKLAYWGGMLPMVALAYQRLTAQQQAAAVTRGYQETLEQRVRERTAELDEANRRLRREADERARLEEELRVSQKMEAVGRLAGGVAHDFNNLLTTIRLYAELLREGLAAGSPLHGELDRIQKAGRQASDLTQQLLAFSRRGDVETEVLDLDQVILEASSMLRHLLGEDVRLVCQRAGSETRGIRADRGQVEQVLVNLILNARDAMPEGGRVVLETSLLGRSELREREFPESLAGDAYVLLTVTDTGVGMDPETRERAFDPFFTRKPVDRGTGLGLSIVYGSLSHSGGYVRVQSEPDKGARFELLWPRVSEAPTRRDPDARRPAQAGAERILLVEDDPDLRAVLHRVLSRCGYTVVDADDAESALRIAREDGAAIDLVLSDVVMPRMSGFELVERMAVERPRAKALLISGHLNHPSLRDGKLPGGVPLLRKPFEAEQLTAKVREVLASPAPGSDS